MAVSAGINTALLLPCQATALKSGLYHGRSDGHDGPCFDDIAFAPATWTSKVSAEGWGPKAETDVEGYSRVAVGTEKYHGAYSVEITVNSIGTPGHRVYWFNTMDAIISLENATEYTFSARVKGAAPCNISFFLYLWNGSENREVESPLFAVGTDWTHCYWHWTSAIDDKTAWIAVTLAEVGTIYIDAVTFGKKNPNDPTGAYFISGEDYEWNLTTDDAFIQSDAAVPDVVKQSIATYGLREARESVDSITKTSQAESWARGYFGVNAQPVASHKLAVVDPDAEIKPDGHVKLLGASTPPAFPAKVSYSLGGDNVLNASVELSTERPSFELLLAKMARK